MASGLGLGGTRGDCNYGVALRCERKGTLEPLPTTPPYTKVHSALHGSWLTSLAYPRAHHAPSHITNPCIDTHTRLCPSELRLSPSGLQVRLPRTVVKVLGRRGGKDAWLAHSAGAKQKQARARVRVPTLSVEFRLSGKDGTSGGK
jgi:hypothetical protein